MKSINEQENDIRQFLEKYVLHVIDQDHNSFVDFLEIMMAQDQWLDKLDTIDTFRVIRSRINKSLLLQIRLVNYNRWYTVSWRKGTCKKRKESNPLQSAFRQAIRTQIKKWRTNSSFHAQCTHCQETKHLQVDHKYPEFIQLTMNFLCHVKNQSIPTQFDYHYKFGKKFRKQDSLFKKKWQQYHKKHAILQWLCKSCNLKKKHKK